MFIISISVSYANEQWRVFTDYRDVREIIHIDGELWCATSGGLAVFDVNSKEYQQFTTIDGLSGIGITAMSADNAGGLWLAFDNCTVQRFQTNSGVTHVVNELDQESGLNRINWIDISQYGVFLATNRGVARLTYSERFDRWVWFEEYTKLGEFPNGQAATTVLIDGHYLWVGTEIGIARGDMDSPAPRTWENYTYDINLPGKLIRDFVIYNDRIMAASDSGLVQWYDNSWHRFTSSRDIRRLEVINDSLRAIRHAGIYTRIENTWQRNTPPRNYISSMAWDNEGRIWGGMMFDNGAVYTGGIVLATDSSYIEYIPDGPVSNTALNFNFTTEGNVLMVGGYGTGHHGLCIYDGEYWRKWSYPLFKGGAFLKQNRVVQADFDNGIWVGTWGSGLVWYKPDSTIYTYDYSEASGSRLIGYGSAGASLNNVLIPDLAIDDAGSIWLINRGAANGNVLVCVPRDFIQSPEPDKEWHYFHRSLFRNYPHFDRITIDGYGRKWLASSATSVVEGHGVYAFDDNGTLDDPSDDLIWGPFSGLESPRVFSLAWDPDGYLWVGTVNGAYYISANASDLNTQSFMPLYPLRDYQVNVIEIDASGNKWFGTTFGVIVVKDDMFTIQSRITTDKPDMLPNLNVNALAINPHTGEVFFGTDNGTAALVTPYRDYGETLEEISIEPNPFNPNDGKMAFRSFANTAKARIFTPDGRLVRKLNHDEAVLGWDGRNDTGYKVANGVYLIVAHTNDGKALQGKVAVIWK